VWWKGFLEDDCMPPLFCSSNRRRLELASVPCGGTVNHSIFQGGAVQVDVGRIRTVKRHPPFTRYSTRRTVNYLSESESESCFHLSLSSWILFSNKSSVQFSSAHSHVRRILRHRVLYRRWLLVGWSVTFVNCG